MSILSRRWQHIGGSAMVALLACFVLVCAPRGITEQDYRDVTRLAFAEAAEEFFPEADTVMVASNRLKEGQRLEGAGVDFVVEDERNILQSVVPNEVLRYLSLDDLTKTSETTLRIVIRHEIIADRTPQTFLAGGGIKLTYAKTRLGWRLEERFVWSR